MQKALRGSTICAVPFVVDLAMRIFIVAWLALSAISVVVVAWEISPWLALPGAMISWLLLVMAREVWLEP